MGTRNIVTGSKRTQVQGHAAAANSVLTSSIVDMSGFTTVVFDVLFGTTTTGQTKGTLQVQAGNLSTGGDMANLVGASMTITDLMTAVGVTIEVVLANYRYVQLVITRNTQEVEVLGVVATQYNDQRASEGDDATTWLQSVVAVEPQYSQTYYTTVSTVAPNGANTTVVTTYRNAS